MAMQVRDLEPGCRQRKLGGDLSVRADLDERQVTNMACAHRSGVLSALLRVPMPAGGNRRSHFPVLEGGAAIRVLMQMESVRTRDKAGQRRREQEPIRSILGLDRADLRSHP